MNSTDMAVFSTSRKFILILLLILRHLICNVSSQEYQGKVACESLLSPKAAWNAGWNGYVNIPIQEAITSWTLNFEFTDPVTSFEQWTGNTAIYNSTFTSVSKTDSPMSAGSTLTFEILYRFPIESTVPVIKTIMLKGQRICTSGECRPNEWTCKDGTCVPEYERCNGIPNCVDRSDEEHCSQGYVTCESLLSRKNAWNAGWNGNVSIPIQTAITSWTVDFEFTNPLTSFEQWFGNTTIYNSTVTSVWKNNSPMSAGSTLTFEILYRFPIESTVPAIKTIRLKGQRICTSGECSQDEWTCGDGTCVPRDSRCDGTTNCPDRSDEAQCRQTCGAGEWQCEDHSCIRQEGRCDGVYNCRDYSDEKKCPSDVSIEIPENGKPGDACEMGGGVMGICEEIGGCLQRGGIVRREEGSVNICSRQFSNIYVCCRKPHLIARELCNFWSQYWRRENGGCVTEHPLIVNGETANIGEFPHMVRIDQNYPNINRNYKKFICGGTLISPHFVLTAAHCLRSNSKHTTYWVKLGEHDLEHDSSQEVTLKLKGPLPSSLFDFDNLTSSDIINSMTDVAPVEQTIQVEKIIIHPGYHQIFNYNDIALLKLKNPAFMTKRVLPACLPHDFPSDDYRGNRMTVIGWGKTTVQELSRILQKVEIPIVDRLSCSVTGANTYRNTPFGITEDMLCAGERSRDSCQGDSGGPLFFRKPRHSSSCELTIAGVVSFGIGHGSQFCGALGVYTRVSEYLDWITGYIAPKASTFVPTEENEDNTDGESVTGTETMPSNVHDVKFPGHPRSRSIATPIIESQFLWPYDNVEANDSTDRSVVDNNPQIIFGYN